MRKIFLFLISFIFTIPFAFWKEPAILCDWLPWCSSSSTGALNFLWSMVALLIKYVAVFAVFALIWAWFMYIFSVGQEEKAKKARKWIIWSLIWVFISISAYYLVTLVNNININ